MKKKISVCVFLCGLLFCFAPAVGQAASEYLGDLCWSIIDGSPNTKTVKLGVFSMGGGHFLLLGTMKTSLDGTYTVHGNAELIDGKIHMNVVAADGNNNAMNSVHVLAVLDPVTLNGSFNSVSTGADHTGKSAINYGSATVKLIPCK